jgi:hypothetical protein
LKKLINDNYYRKYLHVDISNDFIAYDNGYAESNGGASSTTFYKTPLHTFKEKAIIIIYGGDVNNAFTNVKSGCNYKYDKNNAKTYTQIIPKTPDPNAQSNLEIVVSDETALDEIKPNPDVFTSINDYGYQVTCISYSNYLKEAYLTQNERKYENMFIDFNYSYMLMSELKTYITSNPLYIKV